MIETRIDVNAEQADEALAGQRIFFFGRMGGLPKRDAASLARRHGATVVEKPDCHLTLLVVGEGDALVANLDEVAGSLNDEIISAVRDGRLRIITETQFWSRLGLIDEQSNVRQLYTPTMLAKLVNVPMAVVRKWHRAGLIVPVKEVMRLPYFDFQEVTTAKRLAEMLANGMTPDAIAKKIRAFADLLPGTERPLAQLSIIVSGKNVWLRRSGGLLDPQGQYHFDFEEAERAQSSQGKASEPKAHVTVPFLATGQEAYSLDELLNTASSLEDDGNVPAAIDMYRASLALGGPCAETCFRLAELLYWNGERAAARERYYMAIELDEDFVEARFGLGCVLADLEEFELAIAAFQGALEFHPSYADVHFHLATILKQLGSHEEAACHWEQFCRLAPESPWTNDTVPRFNGGEPTAVHPADIV